MKGDHMVKSKKGTKSMHPPRYNRTVPYILYCNMCEVQNGKYKYY